MPWDRNRTGHWIQLLADSRRSRDRSYAENVDRRCESGPIRSARSRKMFSPLEPELENIVNGVPVWKLAIPLTSHPSASRRAKPFPFLKGRSSGNFQIPLITRRRETSKLASPRSKEGLNGSVKSELL